jgi:four helix bundle protein
VIVLRSTFDGMRRAIRRGMIARRYEDLDAWQLANELKEEVYALIKDGPASRDFEFRDQIRGSAASTTRNIAEGFGRFRPKEFAKFMEYATASVMETQVSLNDGVDRGYFTPQRVARALKLAQRTIQVSKRLIIYLKTCKPRNPPHR